MSCSTQPQLACNMGHAQDYNLNQDKLQKMMMNSEKNKKNDDESDEPWFVSWDFGFSTKPCLEEP